MIQPKEINAILENELISEFIEARHSGVPVFKGTNVPVYSLLVRLSEGMRHSEIDEDFPGLTKKHIKAALLFSSELVLSIGS